MSNYDRIKAECYEANLLLPEFKLIDLTFGNVSVADPDQGVFAIKPSGVDYTQLTGKRHSHYRHGRAGRRRRAAALLGYTDPPAIVPGIYGDTFHCSYAFARPPLPLRNPEGAFHVSAPRTPIIFMEKFQSPGR